MEVLFKVTESDERRSLVAYEKWRDKALLEKSPAAQLERRSNVIAARLESNLQHQEAGGSSLASTCRV